MPGRHSRHYAALYKIALPKAQHVSPHQTGRPRPVNKTQNQNNAPEPRTEDSRSHQHQQNVGKGHDHVRKPHNRNVDPAPKISCGQPQGRADGRGDHGGQDSHQEGDPGGIEKAAQHIPANLIRTQKKFRTWRRGKGPRDGLRIIGGQHRSEKGSAADEDQKHQAYAGQPVAPETAPNHFPITLIFHIHLADIPLSQPCPSYLMAGFTRA